MKKILYIHGFNGNPKGGTFDGLAECFRDSDYELISFPFPHLHTDVEETQRLIEKYVDENDVKILVGASLGGFYALCCEKPVFKIAINPCMVPSVEIELLRDRDTGKNISIDKTVLEKWKELEQYNLKDEFRQAVAIFGKQDETFHYDENHNFKPLFDKIFPSPRNIKSTLVDGVHSLTVEQIKEGFEKISGFVCEIDCIEGIVDGLSEVVTEKNRTMAFIKINGKKIAVFLNAYEKYGKLIKFGAKLRVFGKIEKNSDLVDYDFIGCEVME